MTRTEQPLLSICIPTFNRARYLKKNIDSIVRQPEFQDGSVEIVVSDNVSEDATQALCESYAARFANFRYFRNEKNIRDANFPLALSRGRGVLRRLVNDRLWFYDGSLSMMCQEVKRYLHQDEKPVLFFADGLRSGADAVAPLTLDDFMRDASFWVTWIGGFSIWASHCDGLATDTKYCDLQFWQVDKICRMVIEHGGIVVHQRSTYGQAFEKKEIGYGIYELFHDIFFKILSPYYRDGYISDACYEQLQKDVLYDFISEGVAQYDNGNRKYKFLGRQDVNDPQRMKQRIQEDYGDKPYYQDYLMFYEKRKRRIWMKEWIKSFLPVKMRDLLTRFRDRPR